MEIETVRHETSSEKIWIHLNNEYKATEISAIGVDNLDLNNSSEIVRAWSSIIGCRMSDLVTKYKTLAEGTDIAIVFSSNSDGGNKSLNTKATLIAETGIFGDALIVPANNKVFVFSKEEAYSVSEEILKSFFSKPTSSEKDFASPIVEIIERLKEQPELSAEESQIEIKKLEAIFDSFGKDFVGEYLLKSYTHNRTGFIEPVEVVDDSTEVIFETLGVSSMLETDIQTIAVSDVKTGDSLKVPLVIINKKDASGSINKHASLIAGRLIFGTAVFLAASENVDVLKERVSSGKNTDSLEVANFNTSKNSTKYVANIIAALSELDILIDEAIEEEK